MIKRLVLASAGILFFSVTMLGCTAPAAQQTAKGAGIGAAAGAALGAIFHGNIPLAAVAGGVVGGAIAAPPFPTFTIQRLKEANVQVIQLGDNVKIVLSSDYLFGVSSDKLKKNPEYRLDYVADLINAYGDVAVTITAHTDNIASNKDNLVLTQKQARAVQAYLWTRGVKWYQMRALGEGEERNIASNWTVRGSGYNRRIEISFRKGVFSFPPKKTPRYYSK